MSGTAPQTEDPPVAGETAGAGWALIGAFACLILLVLAATALALWDGRRTTIHEYQDRQARLGVVLAEETGRALQAADQVVAATVDQIQAAGIETDDDLRREMASEQISTELKQKLRNLPQLEALTVMDSRGRAVNTSRFWPSAGTGPLAGRRVPSLSGRAGSTTHTSAIRRLAFCQGNGHSSWRAGSLVATAGLLAASTARSH